MASLFLLGSSALSLVNFRGVLIKDLVAAGHTVHACGPDLTSEIAQAVAKLGACPVDLACDRQGLDPLSDLRYAAALRQLLGTIQPDVFLGYTAKPVVWGAPAARAAGVKTVAALITGLGYAFTDGREAKRRLIRAVLSALYRRALPKCDQIMFQNPDDKATFQAMGLIPRRLDAQVVNGSGVDLAHYAPVALPKDPAFLMIARLLKDKGVREYAAACLTLKARHPSVSFRLAGYLDASPDSIQPRELDSWIAGGLEFLGRLDDVRPALAEASCYVLPSYREGTPRTVLEGMAMGRPIITTDAPGCRETVVDGQNGYLVAPRDSVALAKAMEKMINRPELTPVMGDQALAFVRNKYEIHAVNRQMMRILGLPSPIA